MDLSKDTLDRIFVAADSLYEQNGHAAFPTVDAVRKTARVNMNDASTGMKQWRHARMNQAIPVAVHVPEEIQQANATALAALWQAAQELASESLRAARTSWDTERAESETLNKQMADAYEGKAAELEAVQAVVEQLKIESGHMAADKARLGGALDDAHRELATAKMAAERFEATAIEIGHRAAELRTELDHAHQEAGRARAELAGIRQGQAREIEAFRRDLAAAHAKGESERERAQKETRQAREEAATLRGQLEAMREQNAAMFLAAPKRGITDKSHGPR